MIRKSIKAKKKAEQSNLVKINSVLSVSEQKMIAQRFYKIICKMLDIKINNNSNINFNIHPENWSYLVIQLNLAIHQLKYNQDKNKTIH